MRPHGLLHKCSPFDRDRTPMSSALFAPIEIAGKTFENRIVVAPMCQYSANDGCASDWHLTHLGMLANSGAGLVVVEATHVERRGRITHGCVGLYSDACAAALARVVDHCHRIGTAKIGVQLAHAGRKASSQRPWEGGKALAADQDAWPTEAASALPFGDGWHVPQAMTEDDMERVVAAFAEAATRAVRIGFDAIELHAAHGYLVHEFLSPVSNRRTDSYGGSRENRMRFPTAIAQAVRAAVPRSVPLGARITGSDWLDGGIDIEEAIVFARALKEIGYDYADVSSGGLTADARNPTTPGYNVPLAEAVRHATGLVTRAVGLIVDPKQADAVITEGKADMVALARAMLDDPHWGWHAARALGAETRRPPQYLRAGPSLWTPAARQG